MIFGLKSVLQAVYRSPVYRGKFSFFLSVCNYIVALAFCHHYQAKNFPCFKIMELTLLLTWK